MLRVLAHEEWPKLLEFVDPRLLPDPRASWAIVDEDTSGDISGVMFLQLAFHIDSSMHNPKCEQQTPFTDGLEFAEQVITQITGGPAVYHVYLGEDAADSASEFGLVRVDGAVPYVKIAGMDEED